MLVYYTYNVYHILLLYIYKYISYIRIYIYYYIHIICIYIIDYIYHIRYTYIYIIHIIPHIVVGCPKKYSHHPMLIPSTKHEQTRRETRTKPGRFFFGESFETDFKPWLKPLQDGAPQ